MHLITDQALTRAAGAYLIPGNTIRLLKNAAEFGGSSVDQWLLRMDFRLMNFWYRVSGRSAALVEMAGVVAYLADAMGKRIAYQADS